MPGGPVVDAAPTPAPTPTPAAPVRDGAGLFAPTIEAMLHPVLREIGTRLPGAAGRSLLFEEFVGPWGVPDLVVLVAAADRLEARLGVEVPALRSELDCRAVVNATRWIEEGKLVASSGSSTEVGRRRVARLVREGALHRDSQGRLRRAPQIVPVGRVWALEAKMDAWQAGLAQTQRYRLWADGAALVLGRSPVGHPVLADRAEQFRIGVYADGRWVRRPRLALPSPVRRLLASEHVVARLRGGG